MLNKTGRRTSPDIQQKSLEGSKKSSRAPLGIGLAAGLAVLAAINIAIKEQTTQAITSSSVVGSTPKRSEKKTPNLPTPENLAKYLPAQDFGTITKKNFFPGVQKTVIFVPEMHKSSQNGGVLEELDQVANPVHEEIYLIIADLLQKFGKMPLVMETWIKENDRIDVATHPYFQDTVFQQLMSIRDPEKRLEFGRAMAAATDIPADFSLLAAFKGDLSPLGTITKKEAAKLDEDIRDSVARVNLYTTKKPVCDGVISKKSMGISDVSAEFKDGNRKDVKHCYCALHLLTRIDRDQEDQRYNSVPLRELNAALQAPENVVILTSGQAHNQKAIDELGKNKAANYMVISPVTLVKFLKLTADDKEKKVPIRYADAPDHTCEKLGEKHTKLIQGTIKNMLARAAK